MQLVEILNSAERMRREYGAGAAEECAARAGYHKAQGDEELAEQWRLIEEMVRRLGRVDGPQS